MGGATKSGGKPVGIYMKRIHPLVYVNLRDEVLHKEDFALCDIGICDVD